MNNTPIIDPSTLTKKQQKEISILYMYAKTDIDGHSEMGRVVGYARKTILEALFGKEFFEKGG